MKKIAAALPASALLMVLGVTSACADTGSNAAATALLGGVTHGNLKLEKVVPGPGRNIEAIVARSPSGQKMLAWMVDGKYLAPGPLFNAQGENLTLREARKEGLMPKKLPAATTARLAMKAPGFTIGKSGPLMVAFLDPNCIFCHLFWDGVQKDVQDGKVRVKVVPVGFLKPSSFPKAVTILMAKDPASAWAHNEARFTVKTEEGGTRPAKKLSARASNWIHQNTQLLGKTGEVATPTLVVCEGRNKLPVVLHGIARGSLAGLISNAASVQENGTCGGGK